MPVGLLVLVPISQYLILLWGWRPTMLFWAAVTLAIMIPLALMIRNNPEDRGYAPDGEPLDEVMPVVPPLLPGDIYKGAGHGVKTGSGLREAVKTRPFWFLTAAHFICGIGCGFMITHIVIFATDFGYSDMIAASLLSVQGGLNIVGVLVTGHLADRMAGSKVLALTHFVRTISFATISVFILFGGGSLWILYLGMAFFGFGWFTTAPLTAGLVTNLFGSLRMGTILGVTTSSHILGWSIGAYVGGVVFDMTHSYYLVFLIITLLSLLATVFSLAIKQ
jgi:predicted MFS family arabinose efflux permease